MEPYVLISTLMWGDLAGPRVVYPQPSLETCVEVSQAMRWEIPDEMPQGIIVDVCVEIAKEL